MVEKEMLPRGFKWPPNATPYSQGFNHPPREEIEKIIAAEKEKKAKLLQQLKKKSIASYGFCDEAECVTIYISMEGVEKYEPTNTGFLCFCYSNFRYSLTLFSKFFASFPHGSTCTLSVT
jgi:hypothetical protein